MIYPYDTEENFREYMYWTYGIDYEILSMRAAIRDVLLKLLWSPEGLDRMTNVSDMLFQSNRYYSPRGFRVRKSLYEAES